MGSWDAKGTKSRDDASDAASLLRGTMPLDTGILRRMMRLPQTVTQLAHRCNGFARGAVGLAAQRA